MKHIKKFNEDYGLFDKIKASNVKSKINNALKQHGYASEGEFLKEIDKINSYVQVLGKHTLSKDISIKNIQTVYAFKQEYEEMFEVIDELDMLLREIKDEGIQVDYQYNTTHHVYKGSSPSYTGYQGTQGYYNPMTTEDRRNFEITITPKEMNPENLYIIFGVLMEAEGRGEISFQDIRVIGKKIYTYVFIDDLVEEPQTDYKQARYYNNGIIVREQPNAYGDLERDYDEAEDA